MSFFTRAAILFYVTIILFTGCFAILYVLNVLSYKDIADLLYIIYLDDNLRVAVGCVAVGLLFINFILYRQLDVNAHKEKIIAFDNPSGRVRVALVALEDLIRRTISKFPEVKESKVDIRASKRVLSVKIRLVLCSEVNIPELTSIVQETAKRKIQDIIGLDEPLNISVYISKILGDVVKEKRSGKKEEPGERSGVQVPFQGYRA
ncbi:MAG TPA: alkaline shock response membrane anchor protein AmaP [Candidatus Omnitrophica bacterium]|nr:MAG: hypothetical protein A2Y05_01035 [Omnitrophica WOR_2 bacterium GWA2_53_43]HBO97389.1 alkaline shock response membrane anchor protein AmaP [Candidatus Omnitrophota bacterium]HCI44393.1 alkaline shock response membrane anchor protein AmaP [Candidatus Omnitrophota bacterium]